MVRLATSILFAPPKPLTPDPSGAKNVGNGRGAQFITGGCLSDADCASTCCANAGGQGICSGIGAQFQQGKTGCGFGGASSAAASSGQAGTNASPPAAAASPAASSSGASAAGDAAGSQNVGNGQGLQFITGQCLSDADCASGCCAAKAGTGVCSARAVANENGKTGCGFVSTSS